MTEERYQLIHETADQINGNSFDYKTRVYLAIRYLNNYPHGPETINDMLIPNSDEPTRDDDNTKDGYRSIYPYNGTMIRSKSWLAGLILFFFVWFILSAILVSVLSFIFRVNVSNTGLVLILVALGVLIHYIVQVILDRNNRVMENSFLYVLDGGHKTVQEYKEYWEFSNKNIKDSLNKL